MQRTVLDDRARVAVLCHRAHAMRWWALCLCWAFTACLQSDSVRCGDLWCPQGTICAPQLASCVSAARLAACVGKQDDDGCVLSGSQAAHCLQGVCTAIVCGDGLRAGDEVCDDGNNLACDGCSADCRSDETCGNAILDCDEQCDRGDDNSDAQNALCRRSCRRPGCGDGVVDDQSGEDCDGAPNEAESCADYGFYAGAISCSSTCRNDTSSCREWCGDGVVNGSEVCDELAPDGESCLEFGYDVGNLHCSPYCAPDFDRCDRLGFQPLSLPSTTVLRSVWGAPGASELLAVGDEGTTLRYDGTTWHALASGSDAQLMAVWGSAQNDVFAAGRRTGAAVRGSGAVLLHYDGSTWTTVVSVDMRASGLNALWGSSAADIWSVGAAGTLLHYDGETWSLRDSPTQRDLYGVWAASPNEAFAVGDRGTILHYDGSSWRQMQGPVGEALYGIWGSAPDDVYAVGQLGVVIHYDGNAWRQVVIDHEASYFTGVRGRGRGDVFVYGSRGTILHFDGHTWGAVPVSVDQEIQSLWCDAAHDVVGVGAYTAVRLTPGGPVLRTIEPATLEDLTAIWASSLSDVTVVGRLGEIVHYDGARWSEIVPADVNAPGLLAVWGTARDDIYACGERGTLLHFDGASWQPITLSTQVELRAVWASGPDDVYVVGADSTVLHGGRSDGELTPLETGARGALSSVWGFAPDDVYIGGAGGGLWHYDGERWQRVELPTSANVLGLWGPEPSRLFVLTTDGVLLGAAGIGFDATEQPPDAPIAGARGSALRDVFGFTLGTDVLLHYDGIDWAPVRFDNFIPGIHAVWVWPDGTGYVVGMEGTILQLDRFCASRETSCRDRWDNDCDGLHNCHDPDCYGDAACEAGGACQPLVRLDCNATYSGSTVLADRHHSTYPCSRHVERGREVFHALQVERAGEVRLETGANTTALDLIVVGSAAAGGCDPIGACLTSSSMLAPGEPLTFEATAGQTYYLVVEASAAGAGTYTLEVSCP